MPDLVWISVYLDSNVLFSASYTAHNRFLHFCKLTRIIPVTSPYAIAEARSHLERHEQFARFDALRARTEVVADSDVQLIPSRVNIVEKDKPILAAAMAASVDYLVTGDKNHFSHRYGQVVSDVCVLPPAEFLDLFVDRLFD